MEKILLSRLTNDDFIHPLDKASMDRINGVPGFEALTRFIYKNSIEVFYNVKLKGSSIKLSENNCPRVIKIFKEAAEILNMDEVPDIYLERGYRFKNQIIGYEKPIVLLHTNCIDYLDDDQLSFIAGRCLGGIKLGHNKLELFCDVVDQFSAIIPKEVMAVVLMPLFQWKRKSDFSQDRAGLLTCQDFNSAIQVMMLESGIPYGEEKNIDFADYISQAVTFHGNNFVEKTGKAVITLSNESAWIIDRVAELFTWNEMGNLDRILETCK